MPQLIAPPKQNLPARRTEQIREALIHGDAEITTRTTGVRHLVALQDSAEGHQLLRLLGQDVEVDADGTSRAISWLLGSFILPANG
jgi:hypothetical protein